MRSRANAECGMRNAEWWAAGLAAVLVVGVAVVAWADSAAQRAEKLAKLSAEEKEELLRKKERFDALPLEEQDRLRKLHQSLESSPNAPQLAVVMERYTNWLKALQTPAQRTELLSMPPDKRIEAIKEIVREQEKQRFKDFAEYNLPAGDQEHIYQWLDKFVAGHEKEMLDAIRDDRDRYHVRNLEDDRARRKSLIIRMGFRRPDSKMPFPSQAEIDAMVKELSETTRKELAKPPVEDERADRARRLVYAAIGSIALPHASEEELLKYYASLPAEKRAPLENLDAEQLQPALRKLHRMERFSKGRGAPPRGGRGPSGGPPSDLNRQPPGFANPK